MADDIKVNPTPIQRNTLDVATELTQLFFSRFAFDSEKAIQDAFLKFYAVAEAARLTNFKELTEYMPEELKSIIEKRR